MSISKLSFNGWTVLFHPMFIAQLNILVKKVKKLKKQNPDSYSNKNDTKRLAAIRKLAFDVIPSDPSDPKYRQGTTLGSARKHWFRAKFFQQYRLFFRYDKASKIIIYAWVNDDTSKRAYGSKSDAYLVFSKLVDAGTPPDTWDDLIRECQPINDFDEYLENI